MSFLKDIYNDFTRTEPITVETLKTQGKGFLFFGIFMPVLFIIYCMFIYFDDGIVRLNATIISNSLRDSTLSTNYGDFVAGTDGKLYYHTNSILDLLLLNSIEGYNLLDFAFFLYIGIVFYKALKNISESELFQSQIGKAFRKIGTACFVMYALKILYNGTIIPEYFEFRTHNQFQLIETNSSFFYITYAMFGGIIGSFAYYINKGVELQQEKDLTI